ncbi:hypothetical protein GPECTOR_67g290 [Gonium pectorale]|uniref:Glycoprotease 1 n=1 Tax=Gonium pectorale TaxID=33097 RepID=A0A150G560_GONPE|nr:hypothetical protein GPECTOR_67g290 [Gonium pectorale]|eukprot:KXZ44450.1 hypothetical protein GPECTOR_67g290 [Gonium pectorale]
MDGPEPRAKRQKMAHPSSGKSAAIPVTAYRYNERNVFSLLLQSGGLDTPIIYESQHTFAVLDKYPLARGHALLIVKHPAATLLDDLPPAVAQAAFFDLQALARALQRATGCTGLRIAQSNGPAAGQTVPQLHFHLIPVYTDDPSASETASVATPAAERPQLSAADAGPLLAHIRNLLPEAYAPGYHIWAASEAEMEALGWALALSPVAAAPGSVLALSGQLGAGKSTIARGLVRAFTRDPLLEVPSPTFLLCLSYQDDHAYDALEQRDKDPGQAPELLQQDEQQRDQERADGGGSSSTAGAQSPTAALPSARASAVHHMDPYRLGAKNDKMAGLIDFDGALRRDVCVIEWPDRMPGSVMAVVERGLALDASGRLVSLTPLGNRFKPPPPRAGKGGKAKQVQQPQQAQAQQEQQQAPEAAPAAAEGTTGASAADQPGGAGGSDGGAAATAVLLEPAAYEELLRQWRRDYPDRLPPADVAWRGCAGSAADASGPGAAALSGTGAAGAATTINANAAAALSGGNPSDWVVLGIESSCDDTAAAVVRGDGTVLSHQVASQTGLHEQYGGVKPDVARQAHAAAIQATVDSALSSAGVDPASLTAVAVTAGPGLALCLQVGVQHGLALAARHGLPYVPVHHMEAHAMMTRLPSVNDTPMQFPSLLLLVSGGHNMLVLCEGVGRHRIVGTTLDDSVGECFDKIARMAGISAVPGGPHLERLAASARPDAASRYPLTMPLANGAQKDSCNFSFSGLKTQVATLIAQKRKELNLPDLPLPPAIAAEKAAAAAAAAAATAAADGADGEDGEGGEGTAASAVSASVGAQPKAANEELTPEEAARREAAEAEFTAACADIAASFQRTAVRFLQQRTRRALQWLREDALQQLGPSASVSASAAPGAASSPAAPPGFVRSLVVAGGVAANAAVRSGLSEVAAEFGLPCVYPPVRYCTDNGLMVAWTGVERLKMRLYQQPPRQCEGAALEKHVQVIPRWPIGPMDPRSTANKGRAHIKLLH